MAKILFKTSVMVVASVATARPPLHPVERNLSNILSAIAKVLLLSTDSRVFLVGATYQDTYADRINSENLEEQGFRNIQNFPGVVDAQLSMFL